MYGLVLEGGGAKGSYHIGAYRAIMEEGLEIKAIAGTSIGALNGAMLVQGDYEKCYELWHDISYSKVIVANDDVMEKLNQRKLDKEDLRFLADKIKLLIGDRGFDITPFKNLLDTYIDEDKIRNSNIDFGIVTINLTDFKPIKIFKEDIPRGEIKRYLLASAYLPVFKSEKIGGKRYIDGGFYDNLPFKLLQAKGYENLIIVRTHARGLTRKIDPKINAIVISPSDDIGTSYTYEHDSARRNMELGYFDGLKAIRGLMGIKYYIEPKGKDFFFNILLSLDNEQVFMLRENIKTPKIPDKRALFEYIIPKIASVLGLHKSFTYGDFIIALLEKKAEALEINKFKIYSFESLLELIKCTPCKERANCIETSRLGRIIEKVDLVALFNKSDVIIEIADIILCK